jgi:hypothetical protein
MATYQPSEADMARARTRAYAAGIRVAARGTRRSDGARVILTTSSEGAARLHCVAVTERALECDCKAGQHGRYCMHRAVVRDHLVAERAELNRKLRARPARVTTAAERDTAPLYRSNKPFSIFAAS